MTAYGYVRVSHENSTLSGLSPSAQKKAIQQYCEAAGLTLSETHRYPDSEDAPGIFADYSESAWKNQWKVRPAARQIEKLLEPGDDVIIWSIDRGFRSTHDFLTTVGIWQKKGINIHFIREQFNLSSANGKLLGSIIAALAEWQSHVKSERQRDAAAARKAKLSDQSKASPKEKPQECPDYTIIPWKDSNVVLKRIEKLASKPVPGTVYTYARKSKVEHVNDDSLASQKAVTNKHAKYVAGSREGMIIGEHFEDSDVSAYKNDLAKRPSGSRLNEILKEGDVVVVARLDRAWRRLGDMLNTVQDWSRRGVSVYFCDMMLDTTSVMGRFFIQIMAVFAEMESAMKSAATKAAFAEARARGRKACLGIPIGTKVEIDDTAEGRFKMLTWDYQELRELRVIHFLATRWKWSALKISQWMEIQLARRENRKPLPEWGRLNRTRRSTKRRKSPEWLLPKWHKRSVANHVANWDRFRDSVDEMVRRRRAVRRQRMHARKKARMNNEQRIQMQMAEQAQILPFAAERLA